MSTAAKSRPTQPDLDQLTAKAQETNERLADAGRKVSVVYLDGLEKTVAGLAAFERKVAEQSQVEAISTLLDAHADLTQDLTTISVSAARELLV